MPSQKNNTPENKPQKIIVERNIPTCVYGPPEYFEKKVNAEENNRKSFGGFLKKLSKKNK